MAPTKITGFYKDEYCPSSNDLLEFQMGDLSQMVNGDITGHLALCEFCASEVEFYSHYPQEEGSAEVSEIPAPLFELAEALLKHQYSDMRSLNSLLRENEELALDVVK